ncbi:nitrate/nitrite transporter [Chloroflexota bacterium]
MIAKERVTNKWLVLAMTTAVLAGTIGIPFTAMPVLFTSVSKEIELTLAQIGIMWGVFPIGVAIFALPGGMLVDRFGFRKVVAICCFIIALTNASRGFSGDPITLAATMFLCGLSIGALIPSMPKVIGLFFPPRQLGLALGIFNSGFSIGGVLATALTVNLVLPLVGSWRSVLFSYSAVCVILGVIWLLVVKEAAPSQTTVDTDANTAKVPFRESLGAVLRVRDMWLITIANVGMMGSFIAIMGYLPIYLENMGIPKGTADVIASTNFIAGILGTIILPALSDRIGFRKIILISCVGVMAICTYLVSISGAVFYWVLIPLIGFNVQSACTLCFALLLENKEIGTIYGGSAIGILTFGQFSGGFLMPVIGGNLAERNQSWPFVFWAGIIFVAVLCFSLVRAASSHKSVRNTVSVE